MKQIIIFLLVIIVGLMGYNLYEKHKRFSLTDYEYKTPESIDVNKAKKEVLLNYFEAVEATNGYVITQWSANKIDVRHPKNDNAITEAAVIEYRKKLANVAFYEVQLLQSANKKQELPHKKEFKKNPIKKLFYQSPNSNQLIMGESSALAYEIQRLLISKGARLELDGLFLIETFNALKAFEEKCGLFPDGKLDAITLDYLLLEN